MREHQDWGLAHVAVSLDMVDLLSGEKFKSDVDRADGDGVTPLMLAVSLGSKHLTQGVLVAGCRYVIVRHLMPHFCILTPHFHNTHSLQYADKTGNNVFHYSATTSIQIVDILTGSDQVKLCYM